ncbi:DNA-binding response regulator [Burkholderia ubonensis]|uniref:response regulator transcription factor n=1 Tax=Burkholderia ubonensis TaxID=101571 RepID=UPI0009004F6A|nr:response regulator transcription factor [Burkholderia ubonensis]OJA40785.1 DNA-binding response regulator [Burkholderia ubonensis]
MSEPNMQRTVQQPKQIVVVEDDPVQRTLLVTWLKAEDYRVEAFDDGLDARRFLGDSWADLLLLDWDLPGMTGERLLAWVRGRARSIVPVIFQTVHSDEEDIVKILDAGADDFLVKPLEKQTLLARVRALLRRFAALSVDSGRMQLGGYVLARATLTVSDDRASHAFSAKEFDILWHLAEHPGTVVQRQDLLRLVWGADASAQTRTVDMYVSRLRSRLKAAGIGWTVHAAYATGYRLNLGADAEPADRAS